MSNEYAYRKIDIDALEEEILLPSDLYDPDPRGPDGALADAQRRSQDCRNRVSSGDIPGALDTILTAPPFGDGVDQAKDLTNQAVVLILNSTRASDIPNAISRLDQEQQAILMTYIYKNMAALAKGADISGSVLLTWHEKLSEVAGVGCISRVISDRREL